jgi:hypothetical protein
MAKRIFISFAVEDARYRDLLVGQARNEGSPFEFVDMSAKEPWDDKWKTRCRTRIKGCDGAIALLSKNTGSADGARWEMKCCVDEEVPILGVQVHSNDRAPVPPELKGKRVIDWSWDGISKFINGL